MLKFTKERIITFAEYVFDYIITYKKLPEYVEIGEERYIKLITYVNLASTILDTGKSTATIRTQLRNPYLDEEFTFKEKIPYNKFLRMNHHAHKKFEITKILRNIRVDGHDLTFSDYVFILTYIIIKKSNEEKLEIIDGAILEDFLKYYPPKIPSSTTADSNENMKKLFLEKTTILSAANDETETQEEKIIKESEEELKEELKEEIRINKELDKSWSQYLNPFNWF